MSGGLHSLATIIKRLEAATSRLEDLAQLDQSAKGSTQAVVSPQDAPTALSQAPPAPAAAPVAPQIPKTVAAFDESVIEGKLKPFVQLTRDFAGPAVVEQVELVEKEFAHLREFLLQAGSCQKPDPAAFGVLLNPLQADIEAITRHKEANRKDRDWFTHMSVIAEGAPCIGWVSLPAKPGPYINDIKDSTVFYVNKVLKEYKDRDPKHAEWVRAYVAIIEEMRKYVMDHHTTGLVWNPKGVSVADYKPAGAAPQAASGPPLPPPPPPPPAPAPVAPAGGAAAVFAALNRGEEVTKGLRKVDKSEMTHKNPELRASSVVPASGASAPKRPAKPSKPQSLMSKKPPKFALEGNKWVVEFQENNSSLVIEETENSHVVNLFGCKNTTVMVKGKVNAVSLVNCIKTSVLIESVISSVSVTNSPSFTLQITGSAPTIQLDSTDSGQIYLSKDCLNVEITTAKCSSINVSLPVAGEDEGVFEEQAVPEIMKTLVVDGKLVTTIIKDI